MNGDFIPWPQKHGLKIYLRDPNSYTPLINSRDYLLLSSDMTENKKEISKFSQKDAEVRNNSFLLSYIAMCSV